MVAVCYDTTFAFRKGQHVTAAVQAECACCNMLVCSANNMHSKLLPMTAGGLHSIDNACSFCTPCSVMSISLQLIYKCATKWNDNCQS